MPVVGRSGGFFFVAPRSARLIWLIDWISHRIIQRAGTECTTRRNGKAGKVKNAPRPAGKVDRVVTIQIWIAIRPRPIGGSADQPKNVAWQVELIQIKDTRWRLSMPRLRWQPP